jgi:hypothetical protein
MGRFFLYLTPSPSEHQPERFILAGIHPGGLLQKERVRRRLKTSPHPSPKGEGVAEIEAKQGNKFIVV